MQFYKKHYHLHFSFAIWLCKCAVAPLPLHVHMFLWVCSYVHVHHAYPWGGALQGPGLVSGSSLSFRPLDLNNSLNSMPSLSLHLHEAKRKLKKDCRETEGKKRAEKRFKASRLLVLRIFMSLSIFANRLTCPLLESYLWEASVTGEGQITATVRFRRGGGQDWR